MMTGKRKWTQTLFALALLTVFVSGGVLLGKKPPKDDSPPPGRIYFITGGAAGSMLADGSDKRTSELSQPSYLLHNENRWFLDAERSCLEEDAEGNCTNFIMEVYAVREFDGLRVQLTDDESIFSGANGRVHWGKDDSFISFIGIVKGDYAERIYAADLEFDAVTGLPRLTEAPVEVLSGGPLVEVDGVTLVTDINSFAWSHDGTQVVWERRIRELGFRPPSDPKDLMVTDTLTGNTRLLVAGIEPEWSPDGQRIAFVWLYDSGGVGGIATIAPDGNHYLELTTNGARIFSDIQPRWSPDSGHIAFTRTTLSNKGGRTTFFNNISRIPATGGKTKILTDDIGNASALGWR